MIQADTYKDPNEVEANFWWQSQFAGMDFDQLCAALNVRRGLALLRFESLRDLTDGDLTWARAEYRRARELPPSVLIRRAEEASRSGPRCTAPQMAAWVASTVAEIRAGAALLTSRVKE